MEKHSENMNKILLRRRNAVIINAKEPYADAYTKALVATLGKNLETMGYTLSKSLAEELSKLPVQELIDNAKVIENEIKGRLGADVEYHPMYPNFPNSVIGRSDAQLFFDALVYAYSDFTVLPFDPPQEVKAKEQAAEIAKLKVIDLGDINMTKDIAKNLMSSQVAFSPDDKEDLMEISENMKSIKSMIPDKIPNKENLVWLTSEYMDKVSKKENPFLDKITSAKDILRLMVVRGGGDASLVDVQKLKRVSRTEAYAYARKLATMPHAERDLYTQRNLFKYLANINHFRNLKDLNVQRMLDRVYNKTMERSFLSERDKCITEKDFGKLMAMYSTSPGQMGSDVIRLARLATEQEDYNLAKASLCSAFRANAKKMSTLNLLRIESVLKANEEEREFNVYSPKKGLANPYIKEEKREPLPTDLSEALKNIAKEELEDRYKEKRPLGKVYIEKGLSEIKIPTQQRTNSKGSTGLAFGSAFDLKDDSKKIRSFVHWTNKDKEPIDVDLSVTFYDKDFKKLDDLYYGNLVAKRTLPGNQSLAWRCKYGKLRPGEEGEYSPYRPNIDYTVYAVHSGDMRNGGPRGGKGAAEFIDVDLDRLKESLPTVRYFMFTVNIYHGNSFADTPCKFGWMQDDESIEKTMDLAEDGWAHKYKTNRKLFDVTKADRAIEVNTNGTRSIPLIFDVEKEKFIWMDRNPLARSNYGIINNNIVYGNSLRAEAYRAINCMTPDLYTLLEHHIAARAGEITEDPKEADTVFTVERANPEDFPNASAFFCAYDQDMILGDLISDELTDADKAYYEELQEAERIATEGAIER